MHHHGNLKDNRLVEFPQIQPRELINLFQAVHQRVPVHKQLPAMFLTRSNRFQKIY